MKVSQDPSVLQVLLGELKHAVHCHEELAEFLENKQTLSQTHHEWREEIIHA